MNFIEAISLLSVFGDLSSTECTASYEAVAALMERHHEVSALLDTQLVPSKAAAVQREYNMITAMLDQVRKHKPRQFGTLETEVKKSIKSGARSVAFDQ